MKRFVHFRHAEWRCSLSVENAIKFLAKVGSDAAFKNTLTQAAPEKRVELARSAGFTFTREEYDRALAKIDSPKSGALTDADLDNVSGGTGIPDFANMSSDDIKNALNMANNAAQGMVYGGPWLPPGGDDIWGKGW